MIDLRKLKPLTLGPAVVKRLLPHREPLLLVDQIDAWSFDPPALRASRLLSANEPVFAGHFPGRPMWPGAYTVEGLAQCCALLGALLSLNLSPDELTEAHLLERQWPESQSLGVLGAADMKFTRPVLPGQRLEYLVVRTHVIGEASRFEVEATADRQLVARGTLTGAQVNAP